MLFKTEELLSSQGMVSYLGRCGDKGGIEANFLDSRVRYTARGEDRERDWQRDQ